ncbi:hypothetical protein [Marinifilum flexuosum]|uniref:hypothetical protein n=1 Tax=Marinifilum flexuosum TaxID=1117708 RepID=UPI0024954567|nr:hypothetical protein [Marinifilum flexuosum]
MFEIKLLSAVSKELRAWVELFKGYSDERKLETKNAIKALSIAILETQSYLRKDLNEKNQQAEEELKELWNNAHMELRFVEPRIADRCFAKARYWSDPSKWSRNEIEEYNITLDSMSVSLKEIY